MTWNRDLKKHPFNNLPVANESIDIIKTNIKENGYNADLPIILFEGMVLDGWHRYNACIELNVKPVFREFEGTQDDAIKYVVTANIAHRRQLTKWRRACLAILNEDLHNALKKEADMDKRSNIKTHAKHKLANIYGTSFDAIEVAITLKNKKGIEFVKKGAQGDLIWREARRMIGRQVGYHDIIKKGKEQGKRELAEQLLEDQEYTEEESKWLSNEPYVFNEKTDTYVTFLKVAGGAITMKGDTHRAMLQAYSDYDGNPATINEIGREFGFPRSWFIEYKRAHGWTHDLEPFTNEEMATRDKGGMVEDMLAGKRREVSRAFEKRKWAEVQKSANKWEEFKYKQLNPFHIAMDKWVPPKPYRRATSKTDEKFSYVIMASDWQIGAKVAGENISMGQEYNTEIAIAVIKDYLDQIEKDVQSMRYNWSKAYLFGVGDLMHGLTGKTVGGTLLEMDYTGTSQWRSLLDLIIFFIEGIYKIFGEIEMHSVPGNHEGMDWFYMGELLRQRYRGDEWRMKIVTASRSFQYVVIGPSVFILTHGKDPYGYGAKFPVRQGDKRKSAIQQEIINAMQNHIDKKILHKIKHFYFIQGDNHSFHHMENTFFDDIQVGSPVLGDRYADSLRLHSRPSQSCILLSHDNGIKSVLRYYFDINKKWV